MKRILYILPFLLLGCVPSYIAIPSQEYIRVDVHDTVKLIKLVPTFVKIQTPDTFSHLENSYAYSDALWSKGLLTHSLGIKPAEVPVVVPVTTIYKDKTVTVNILTEEQKGIIKEYPKLAKSNRELKQDYDKLKDSNKRKAATIWKLIGLLSLSVLWIFRRPIIKLVKLI